MLYQVTKFIKHYQLKMAEQRKSQEMHKRLNIVIKHLVSLDEERLGQVIADLPDELLEIDHGSLVELLKSILTCKCCFAWK